MPQYKVQFQITFVVQTVVEADDADTLRVEFYERQDHFIEVARPVAITRVHRLKIRKA